MTIKFGSALPLALSANKASTNTPRQQSRGTNFSELGRRELEVIPPRPRRRNATLSEPVRLQLEATAATPRSKSKHSRPNSVAEFFEANATTLQSQSKQSRPNSVTEPFETNATTPRSKSKQSEASAPRPVQLAAPTTPRCSRRSSYRARRSEPLARDTADEASSQMLPESPKSGRSAVPLFIQLPKLEPLEEPPRMFLESPTSTATPLSDHADWASSRVLSESPKNGRPATSLLELPSEENEKELQAREELVPKREELSRLSQCEEQEQWDRQGSSPVPGGVWPPQDEACHPTSPPGECGGALPSAAAAEDIRPVAVSLGVPAPLVRRAYDVFKKYATIPTGCTSISRDGFLKRHQFKLAAAGTLGVNSRALGEVAINQIFQELDPGGSAHINFFEFAKWVNKHSFDESLPSARQTESRSMDHTLSDWLTIPLEDVVACRAIFSKFDLDGDGVIDRNEFKLFLYELMKLRPWDLPPSRMHLWWRLADVDQNGEISFQEFAIFHTKHIATNGSIILSDAGCRTSMSIARSDSDRRAPPLGAAGASARALLTRGGRSKPPSPTSSAGECAELPQAARRGGGGPVGTDGEVPCRVASAC